MIELVVVSVIWSFSFGLIGHFLLGLDSNFVAFARMALALLVFLPFVRPGRLPPRLILRLAGIGALQLGVMYVAYIRAYGYLESHEVALFTVFTPLWITMLDGLLARRLTIRFHAAALVAIAGALTIVWSEKDLAPTITGLLLVQVANLAFGGGQVLYRNTMAAHPDLPHREAMGWLYLGAVAVTLTAMSVTFDPAAFSITTTQVVVLVYLGLVAAGLGFFLWNRGATKVSAGVLAVMNNGYMPIAVLAGVLLYGESADPLRLSVGAALIVAALFVNGRGFIRPTASRRSSRG